VNISTISAQLYQELAGTMLEFRFYRGLSDKVKDIICLEGRPNTLEEYIQKAQDIDDKLLEREHDFQAEGLLSWEVVMLD
jgi:hypothetical protein